MKTFLLFIHFQFFQEFFLESTKKWRWRHLEKNARQIQNTYEWKKNREITWRQSLNIFSTFRIFQWSIRSLSFSKQFSENFYWLNKSWVRRQCTVAERGFIRERGRQETSTNFKKISAVFVAINLQLTTIMSGIRGIPHYPAKWWCFCHENWQTEDTRWLLRRTFRQVMSGSAFIFGGK